MHRRFDTLDRHAADVMFLVGSTQELLLDKRREFSKQSRVTIRSIVAAPPYEGKCPSCNEKEVLGPQATRLLGAEYDHFFHGGLNRPEHGWLICGSCHHELTNGGYLVRFAKMPEFGSSRPRASSNAGTTWPVRPNEVKPQDPVFPDQGGRGFFLRGS